MITLSSSLSFVFLLSQLIQFTGVNLREKSIDPVSRCQGLGWVPFLPDADPNTDSEDVWGFAPLMSMSGDWNIPLKSGEKHLSASDLSLVHEKPLKKKNKKTSKVEEQNSHTLGVQKESGELWFIFQIADILIDKMEGAFVGKLS